MFQNVFDILSQHLFILNALWILRSGYSFSVRAPLLFIWRHFLVVQDFLTVCHFKDNYLITLICEYCNCNKIIQNIENVLICCISGT
jgi:hypothetical protein